MAMEGQRHKFRRPELPTSQLDWGMRPGCRRSVGKPRHWWSETVRQLSVNSRRRSCVFEEQRSGRRLAAKASPRRINRQTALAIATIDGGITIHDESKNVQSPDVRESHKAGMFFVPQGEASSAKTSAKSQYRHGSQAQTASCAGGRL